MCDKIGRDLTFVPLLFDALKFRSLNSTNILLQLFEKKPLFLINWQILFINRVRGLGCGPYTPANVCWSTLLNKRFKFLSRLFQSTENKLLFVSSKSTKFSSTSTALFARKRHFQFAFIQADRQICV